MKLSEILKKHSKKASKLAYVCNLKTPVGNIIACADEDNLHLLAFEDSNKLEKMIQIVANSLSCEFIEGKNKILSTLECELQEYFDGKLKNFTVPVETCGTEFQKEVWNQLTKIPYGTTQTYGTLAKDMGREVSHSRAVGSACGANAHLLIIPCHRLVGTASNGGFSCGVDRKEWLIQHEKKFAL